MEVDLSLMRSSGKILAHVIQEAEKWILPGTTPKEIAKKTEEAIRSYNDASPAFLGYRGFPAPVCISVNTEVVHGIPSDVILKEGDIVSYDCGVLYKGHYSDAARTFMIGNVFERTRRLVKTTKEALDKGIEASVIGNYVGDISYAIQRHTERKGFSVNLDLTGHGIGLSLHQSPAVPNYGPPKTGELLEEGMCLALEPVVFDGSNEIALREDGWTIFSKESNLSAHFEDTIIITRNGPEIITRL